MSHITLRIPLPSSPDGYSRRTCSNAKLCGGTFHIQSTSVPDAIFCPYCGDKAGLQETHTAQDIRYAKMVARARLEKYAHDEFAKMLKKTFGRPGGGFTFKASPFRERHVVKPRVLERLDSLIACPSCKFRFKVNGIFGYCPNCRTESVLIYDENLRVILDEVAASKNPRRALRSAYSDLVSAMEAFFKRKDPAEKRPTAWFQKLPNIESFVLGRVGKKIEEITAPDELEALRCVFQKRHCIIHNQGRADDAYKQNCPTSPERIGEEVTLSEGELKLAATATHKIITATFV